MADPVDPTQPPPVDPAPPPASPPPPLSSSAPDPEVNPSTTGLPSNVAAAIACIPLIGGIIFYVLEKRDGFVRFYAMQSIIFGGAWLLFNIVYSIVHVIFASVPAIGTFLAILWGLVGMLVHLAFVVVWIIATIKAFTNVRWDIPYIGPIARKQFQGTAL
jgi:uncharacterized membrane protein